MQDADDFYNIYCIHLALLLEKKRLFILQDKQSARFNIAWREPTSNQLGFVDSADYKPFNLFKHSSNSSDSFSSGDQAGAVGVDAPAEADAVEEMDRILSQEWWPILFQFREHSFFYTFYAQQKLHLASLCGNTAAVTRLLEEGVAVDKVIHAGITPLHIACLRDDSEIAMLLLKNSAGINKANNSGVTPLHLASLMGKSAVVKCLLEHNAQEKCLEKNRAKIDCITNCGLTPLHLAALSEDTQTVALLLASGADVNQSNDNNILPLHLACLKGDAKIVAFLLENDAKLDACVEGGMTTLHLACLSAKEEIIAILLKQGAEVDKATNSGVTPLHLASLNGYKGIVRLLLNAGADVNKTFNVGINGGVSAVALAGDNEMLHLLLEANNNLQHKNQRLSAYGHLFQAPAANVAITEDLFEEENNYAAVAS